MVLRHRPGNASPEGLVGHSTDGGEALGDRVAVAAVGAGDMVVGTQRRARPNRRGLLAD